MWNKFCKSRETLHNLSTYSSPNLPAKHPLSVAREHHADFMHCLSANHKSLRSGLQNPECQVYQKQRLNFDHHSEGTESTFSLVDMSGEKKSGVL